MSDAGLHAAGSEGGDGIRAAEYVLQLLEPAERSAFETRLDRNGGLRALVADWTEQFARMAQEVREVRPPAAVRKNLARFVAGEVSGVSRPRRGSMAGGVLRGLMGGLAVAAAVVVLLLMALPEVQPPSAGTIYTAEIASEDNSFVVSARYDASDSTLSLTRAAGEVPPGRVLQLWLLPDGAAAPLSVAILPEDQEVNLVLSDPVASDIPGGLLEISEEPPGGSPEAGPTGNVLGIGNVAATPVD